MLSSLMRFAKLDYLKTQTYKILNKKSNLMQQYADIYCKVTLHVSGITAPIIRSTKNCNCYLWYRSYSDFAVNKCLHTVASSWNFY